MPEWHYVDFHYWGNSPQFSYRYARKEPSERARSIKDSRVDVCADQKRPPPCCKNEGNAFSGWEGEKKEGERYIKRKKKRVESPCLFPNGFYARQTVVGGPSHDMDAAGLSLGSRESEITGIQVSANRVVPWRRRGGGGGGYTGRDANVGLVPNTRTPGARMHTYVYAHICKYASRQRSVHRNRIGGGPSMRLSTLIRREVACAVIGHRISVTHLYLWDSNWSNLWYAYPSSFLYHCMLRCF